jgi:hypothetical protein
MEKLCLALILGLLLAGCVGPGAANRTAPASGGIPPQGSANFQRCASQCGAGNYGNGTFCKDGCRLQEAADTKSTVWCDLLDQRSNRAACYGIVAKSAGDITICNHLSDDTDKNHCISAFGSSSTN